MRELDIKMSELAKYTGVSRPTLYKYVELYENKDYGDIPEKFLHLFRYVNKRTVISKEQVIIYAITEFSDGGGDTKDTIRRYIASKGGNDPKIQMIYHLVTTDLFDDVVPYLVACAETYRTGDYNDDAVMQLSQYIIFRDYVKKNTPVNNEDLNEIKKELRDE